MTSRKKIDFKRFKFGFILWSCISISIFTLEILGDATMVTVKVGKSLVSIKANKNFRANIEDKVSVKIPAQKCHLFDKKTGERVGGINTS